MIDFIKIAFSTTTCILFINLSNADIVLHYLFTFMHKLWVCISQEGDRISLVRKSNGCLHYYINAIDQGIAATRTPQTIWGVVDLYGMAVKVTIIDQSEQNCPGSRREPVNTQPNNYLLRFSDMNEDEGNPHI